MKGLNWFDKFLFFLNIVFALALIFSYLLPYIPPSTFALLSVFSLGVPFLIVANFIFFVFWLLRMRSQMLLSLVVLLLGFNHVTSIYEISTSEDIDEKEDILEVLSYNVRQFNQYGWAEDIDIPAKIANFIQEQDPDVVSMQEYYKGEKTIAGSFPYKYIKLKEKNAEFGLAIFSKYPIINEGSLDFPTNSNNNAIFADIKKGNDTIRILNVHLQSFHIKPDLDKLEKQETKRLFLGMGQTFVRQQHQMELVLENIKEAPSHKIVVMGDFNNTAYSYVYRELKSAGFYDAYKEAGNGFGKTFQINYFPLRIDFILPSEAIQILNFEDYKVPFSDHYPIKATLYLNEL